MFRLHTADEGGSLIDNKVSRRRRFYESYLSADSLSYSQIN